MSVHYLRDQSECVGTYTDDFGREQERVWVNAYGNFDNIGNGLLTLFEVSSLEGWPGIMARSMDIVDGGQQINGSPANALFFVLFVIIGSFFMVNLFVGVVVNKFQAETMAKFDLRM